MVVLQDTSRKPCNFSLMQHSHVAFSILGVGVSSFEFQRRGSEESRLAGCSCGFITG